MRRTRPSDGSGRCMSRLAARWLGWHRRADQGVWLATGDVGTGVNLVAAGGEELMDLWSHCENPYPFVPAEVLAQADSVRASLPNRYCDPAIAARLFDEVLDEHAY